VITVFKYELNFFDPAKDFVKLHLPYGAKVLSVQEQSHRMFAWVHQNTTAPSEDRYFQIVGTGRHAPSLGTVEDHWTVQMPPFVWHVFLLTLVAENGQPWERVELTP
jgi:hypothetical protein